MDLVDAVLAGHEAQRPLVCKGRILLRLTVVQRCHEAVVLVTARRDHLAVQVAPCPVHGDGEGHGLVGLHVLGHAAQLDLAGVARLGHHVHLERAVRDVLVVELDADAVLAC
ncbi:unnamed protein product, partial [Ixodes hexagonus]